ncbi:MAG: hypothetical protein NVSMB18_03740 [Acetobacteraceae bacterium]
MKGVALRWWPGREAATGLRAEPAREWREHRKRHTDLDAALGNGELALAWRPQVGTACRDKVTGFEVMPRWNHPNEGLIQSDVLLPLAEANGAGAEIGSWALREACHEAAGWSKPLPLTVRLSPTQAGAGAAFAEQAETILTESGLAPARLMLAIPDRLLDPAPERVLRTLEPLRRLGIRLALDCAADTETLAALLRAFAFDAVRISLGIAAPDPARVRAAFAPARDRGLTTVATEIETEAQFAALRDAGCDTVFGPLIGRPSAIEAFDRVIYHVAADRSPGSRMRHSAI